MRVEEDLILILEIVSAITVVLAVINFVFIRRNRKLEQRQEMLRRQLAQDEQRFDKIYREIHDNIGQALSLAKLNLHAVEPDLPDRINEKLRHSRHLIGKAITDLRDLSRKCDATGAIANSTPAKNRDCTVGISKQAI